VEGEVLDVQSERSDQYWSINIKKGLISLLQLKISGRSTSTTTDSYLSDSSTYRPGNRFYDVAKPLFGGRLASNDSFKVMEVGVDLTKMLF